MMEVSKFDFSRLSESERLSPWNTWLSCHNPDPKGHVQCPMSVCKNCLLFALRLVEACRCICSGEFAFIMPWISIPWKDLPSAYPDAMKLERKSTSEFSTDCPAPWVAMLNIVASEDIIEDFRTQHNFATFWISMEPWSQWKQSQVLADPKDAEAVATAMVLTNFLKPKLLTTNLPPPSLLLEGSKARVQSGSKAWKVEFHWNLASTPAMFGYVWIW